MTTDSYVVRPRFFPGGDIGRLAVYGTVNDLAMCGAKPAHLSVGFILEEGLAMEELWRIVLSMREAATESGAHLEHVDAARARELCPVLREGYVAAGELEPGSMSIDVAGLFDAFLRGLRARGGTVVNRAEVTALARVGDAWEIRAGDEVYRAPVVVNAAGAWCDEVAALAGARPVGLQPLRRTAIVFDPPPGVEKKPARYFSEISSRSACSFAAASPWSTKAASQSASSSRRKHRASFPYFKAARNSCSVIEIPEFGGM